MYFLKQASGIKLAVVLLVIAAAVYFSFTPLTSGLNLGLDLQGGAQVVLQAVPDQDDAVSAEDMNHLVEVMRNRVDAFGVTEPIIQRQGSDRLLVELAGVDEPERAIELLGRTARLEFRSPTGEVLLTGAYLDDARAIEDPNFSIFDQHGTRFFIALTFNSEGAQLFEEATRRYLGQRISIFLDDELLNNPSVQNVIIGGQATISGFNSLEEAAIEATLLREGSLPLDLNILSQRTIGPTLGQDSLARSLNAAIIGLIILALFMLLYYRVPGIWACVALTLYTLLLLWLLYLFNATLTLTSIAGFILSIGMVVDSNIIIYERIKEELYRGKTLKAAIESGFKRALATIIDSNSTTFLVALVLYFFGTGSIRGFALTLMLGIVTSMFTAVTFTRFMLRRASDISFLAHKELYGMNKKQFIPNLNILSKSMIWYIIALLVIGPGLASGVGRGLNLGIDFTGGSILQIQYDQPVELAEVREIVSAQVEQTPSIQEIENNQFQIRTEELDYTASGYLVASLENLGELTLLSTERIGPIIGAELLRNAQWAIIIAIVLLLAYITLRFQFNFALAAIIALVHDALVVISVFALFRIEIDSGFIAAILTVLGYSINNTIVVFDRIRENVQAEGKLTAKEVINQSINQTLTRSTNTALTVLFVLLALLLFGGETTRNFVLALTVGVSAGFYSSLLLIGSILERLSRKTGLIVGKSRTKAGAKTTHADLKA